MIVIKEKIPREEFFIKVIGDNIEVDTSDSVNTVISLPDNHIFDVIVKYEGTTFIVRDIESIDFDSDCENRIFFYGHIPEGSSDHAKLTIDGIDVNKYDIIIKKDETSVTNKLILIISENDIQKEV